MNKIAVINDLSGFGRCSLTAALPIISTLGVQACPLPTAILSSQTAFPSYTCVDFTKEMGNIRTEWQKLSTSFNGIYTGFVSCEDQIDEIFKFVDYFHTNDTFLLVDPIMGDDGETYDMFTPSLLKKMITLTKQADIITPNLTELCLISDLDFDVISMIKDKVELFNTLSDICLELLIDGPNEIIVTGIHYIEDNVKMVANLYVSRTEITHSSHPYLGGSYSGTGDIFASCIAAGLAKGTKASDMMIVASDFLFQSINDTQNDNMDYIHGINFEQHLNTLYKLNQTITSK